MKRLGPWDDRNYQVTVEDLELLAENESEAKDPIPVFFRIQLRRANPALRTSGPAQYPRNALQSFFLMCGGYLIDGRYYRAATRTETGFVVDTDSPSTAAADVSVEPGCEAPRQ